jgi:hypothetical protein
MQPAVCHFYILHLVFCILRFIPLEPIAPARSGGEVFILRRHTLIPRPQVVHAEGEVGGQ